MAHGAYDLRIMRSPSFIIVDPSLKDFIGHHFAYDNSVAEAAVAAGYKPVVLGHCDVAPEVSGVLDITPAFRRDIWGRHPHIARFCDLPAKAGAWARDLDNWLCARDFWADLRRALARVEMAAGSIMLAHMITMKHLPAFGRGLGRFFAGGPGRTVILLLRYQAAFYDNPACAQAFRRLEALAAQGHAIRLASDSGRLADQIGLLTTLAVEVLPIPHPPPEPTHATTRGSRLRFASLGNARDEKGYFEILQAIRILQMEPFGLDGLEFWLQSNHPQPDVKEAIDAFAADLPPEVTLIHQGMDEAAYHAAVQAADVVMAPYWRSIYEARTSGVLLEALASAKPVIATEDCWMSDELALHGAGILVPNRDPLALAAAIRRMADEYAEFAARAVADRPAVLARHSAAAVIAQCAASPPQRRPGRPPRRLAVFYPWDDVLANRGGASLRVNMMLNMVAPLVERVDVLQQGHAAPARRGNVFVESAGRSRWHDRLRRVLRLATWPLLGRAGFGQELLLWYHLERLPMRRFRRRVEEMVAASDAVLLEYSFHASIVLAAARRHRKPVILSQYDVLSHQVRSSALLRRLTLAFEVAALRAAPHAFTVSESDRAAFLAGGVESRVVPNPVDLARSQAALPLPPRRVLEEAFGLSLPPGPLAIFIGSRFGPNQVAAAHMRKLARLCPSVGFVVAGACMEPVQDRNFSALGMIDEAALIALYRAAAVVLVPLESGSGSSLKTVEAMAAGVPVLGTPVAFRGLDVESGVDCLVEPDMMLWPGRITRLLANPLRASQIGAAGRQVAQALDYRVVFEAYTETLNLPRDEGGAAAQLAGLEASLLRQIRSAARSRGATALLQELPAAPAHGDAEDAPSDETPGAARRPSVQLLHPAVQDAVQGALARSRLHLAVAQHLMAFQPPDLSELPVAEELEALEREIEGLIEQSCEGGAVLLARLERQAGDATLRHAAGPACEMLPAPYAASEARPQPEA